MTGAASKPQYIAGFESLKDPSERYGLDEIVYTDRGGGLLQVAHDMDELKKTSAAEWKALQKRCLAQDYSWAATASEYLHS